MTGSGRQCHTKNASCSSKASERRRFHLSFAQVSQRLKTSGVSGISPQSFTDTTSLTLYTMFCRVTTNSQQLLHYPPVFSCVLHFKCFAVQACISTSSSWVSRRQSLDLSRFLRHQNDGAKSPAKMPIRGSAAESGL